MDSDIGRSQLDLRSKMPFNDVVGPLQGDGRRIRTRTCQLVSRADQADNTGRHLNEDAAANVGHRRDPRLRPVVRTAMHRPVLVVSLEVDDGQGVRKLDTDMG